MAGPWADVRALQCRRRVDRLCGLHRRLAVGADQRLSFAAADRTRSASRQFPFSSNWGSRSARIGIWRSSALGRPVAARCRFQARYSSAARWRMSSSSEVGLQMLSLIRVGRLARGLSCTRFCSAMCALGALTPLIANFAQAVGPPVAAIVVGTISPRSRRRAVGHRLFRDRPGARRARRRPPTFARSCATGARARCKGAIYGGVFMFLVLAARARRCAILLHRLRQAQRAVCSRRSRARCAFPLTQTLIGSADGTPPFFGRLRDDYRDPRAYARGVVVGRGAAWPRPRPRRTRSGAAFLARCSSSARSPTPASSRCSTRRASSRASGASCGPGGSTRSASLIGGMVAGALGWYFDAAQINVVVAKFWAYADVNYRADRPRARRLRHLSAVQQIRRDQPWRSRRRHAAVLHRIARRRDQLVDRRAAVRINVVLLDGVDRAQPAPIRGLFSANGLQGLFEQAVRVMRWGLWMSPIINSFLRQSPDPTWYNQDGAVRSLVAIGADIGLPGPDFRCSA